MFSASSEKRRLCFYAKGSKTTNGCFIEPLFGPEPLNKATVRLKESRFTLTPKSFPSFSFSSLGVQPAFKRFHGRSGQLERKKLFVFAVIFSNSMPKKSITRAERQNEALFRLKFP